MWVERMHELGPRFAERAAAHDGADEFVARNFADLKAARVFSAGVPEELGGGGARITELGEMLRVLAGYCGSTALSLSMHTHQVATAAWRWRNDSGAAEPLLRRVAAEELTLISSGGSDWLHSSGTAEPTPDGYRVTARKIFASGSPAGGLLMTSAVLQDPEAGPTVLHFPVPLDDRAVRLLDTWHTLGMRGTGSHDVLLEGVEIPARAVGARRPQGRWTPMMHVASLHALPLIYAVYLGLAEAARALALAAAARRREDPAVQLLVGEMDNQLMVARLAVERMFAVAGSQPPSPLSTNEIAMARTIAGQAAIHTVERAMEVAGGGGFYRALGLERIFRDVQAARYHPMQEKVQLRFSGRCALGLPLDE